MSIAPEKQNAAPGPIILQGKIGSTLYKLGIHFNPDARETLEDKIRRLLKNDLKSAPENVTMDSLQALEDIYSM